MKIKIKLPNHPNEDTKLDASHVILASRSQDETTTAILVQGRTSERMLQEDLEHLLQSLYKDHPGAVMLAVRSLKSDMNEEEEQ